MTIRFDQDILLAKTATVRRYVEVIRRLWFDNDPPVPGWIRLDVTVLNLQRAVEACLDMGTHLIAINSWKLPASAVEVMETLVSAGLLPASELSIYRGMIGFRNVAVHNYTEIDQAIVTGIVNDHLQDFERFVTRILQATVGEGRAEG
ncbi:MAG TPA: DUF86 domain-containing protein [Planctomycetaceae bacterium]|nr:DUF86 domain-containing protein [Planctomycetaceae bacterium]